MKIKLEVGLNVTEPLGITHYEKPIPACLGGLVRGSFPSHLISKTDEERIQNIPRVIEELQGVEVYSTVKCDGTSATYINYNNDFQVCSRNNSMKLDGNNVYLTMAKKYDIMGVLKGLNIAIQGEICGPGIQKNRLGLKEVDLFIFNVWDIEKRKYFNGRELKNICTMMGLKTVPFNCPFTFNHTIEQLLEMAKGLYPETKNRREGIVIRPVEEMYSKTLKGRMSFKVLNNEYLLEHGE